MRRMMLLAGVLLTFGVLLPASTAASTTYHGKWTSAFGVTTSGQVVPWNVFGTWNVNGDRLTGMEAHVPPPVACDGVTTHPVAGAFTFLFGQPFLREGNQFDWIGTWTNGVFTVHTTVGGPPSVGLDITITLDPTANPPAVIQVDILNCPHADWQHLTYYGDLLP